MMIRAAAAKTWQRCASSITRNDVRTRISSIYPCLKLCSERGIHGKLASNQACRQFSTQFDEDNVNEDIAFHLNSFQQYDNEPMTTIPAFEEPNRTSLLMELTDRIGMLHEVLRFFWKFDVNITRIESRPSRANRFDFFVDMEGNVGDDNVDRLLSSLKKIGVKKLLILDEKQGE